MEIRSLTIGGEVEENFGRNGPCYSRDRTLFGHFGLRTEMAAEGWPRTGVRDRQKREREDHFCSSARSMPRERRLRLEEESSSETWSHKWKLAVSSAIMRGTLR